MTALREYVKVYNRELRIKLPDDFDYEEVEVVILPKDESLVGFWREDELQQLGKTGHHSAGLEDDGEDYATW